MIDIQAITRRIIHNKKEKGFNTTSVPEEFCLLVEEVGEAYHAYSRALPDVHHELADIAIFLCSIAHMLEIDLEAAITEKVAINEARTYDWVDGVPIRSDT